jgi:hypothetical protein
MSHLEPTYLRYFYDGLIKGSTQQVDSNYLIIILLLNIVVQFVKQGQIEKAEVILKEIITRPGKRDSELFHPEMLVPVIIEFSKMGELERAMELTKKITDISSKGSALMNIAIEQVKQGNWNFAEEISLQIQQTNQRYWCWERIGKEKLFQLYGLNALFFSNTNPNWINRLNQSLNLQWALDIKNQMRN